MLVVLVLDATGRAFCVDNRQEIQHATKVWELMRDFFPLAPWKVLKLQKKYA